jgi:vacuolar protein sorting-associated protein 45
MKSLAGSAQQTAAGSMNVFAAAQWYVQTKILGSIQGMKALLLDDCTATIAGLVCSQSRALELQVYCVDRLKNESRRPMGGFRAVCLLRPTGESVRALRDELAAPTFDEYHVFFTSTLPDHLLKDLAQADKKQVKAVPLCIEIRTS